MIYLLDTNVCIGYLRLPRSVVGQKLTAQQPHDVALCSIVKSELIYGAAHSQRPVQQLEQLEQFFAPYVSLPFDDEAAVIAGQVRAELAAKGTPIGPYDLQIAAIALAHNLVLVTHNTREFKRVLGLSIEDWERDDTTDHP